MSSHAVMKAFPNDIAVLQYFLDRKYSGEQLTLPLDSARKLLSCDSLVHSFLIETLQEMLTIKASRQAAAKELSKKFKTVFLNTLNMVVGCRSLGCQHSEG